MLRYGLFFLKKGGFLIKEKIIQKSILEYLQYHPDIAWAERMNVGAHVISDKNSRRYVRYAFKGCSDIIGQLKNGKILAVEVKSEKGVLSDFQREFIDKVRSNSGIALMARSIDDVQKALDKNSCL